MCSIKDTLIVNQVMGHKLFLSKLHQLFHSIPTANVTNELESNLISLACK